MYRKRCLKCQRKRLAKFFSKRSASSDGLQKICKDCANSNNHKYYKNNKSYYTKYNTTDKTISVYEASYDEANENNISSFSNIYTFTGNYESNVNVTIACNLEGTYLLCAIEEINAQNEVDKKELRQVDLTLVPKMDTLIMSS